MSCSCRRSSVIFLGVSPFWIIVLLLPWTRKSHHPNKYKIELFQKPHHPANQSSWEIIQLFCIHPVEFVFWNGMVIRLSLVVLYLGINLQNKKRTLFCLNRCCSKCYSLHSPSSRCSYSLLFIPTAPTISRPPPSTTSCVRAQSSTVFDHPTAARHLVPTGSLLYPRSRTSEGVWAAAPPQPLSVASSTVAYPPSDAISMPDACYTAARRLLRV